MSSKVDAAPPLWRGIFGASGAKIVGLVLGLATLSLTARWLGPEGRGMLAVISTWAMLAATLGHLSLGQVAIHQAVGRPHGDWLGEAMGGLTAAAAGVTLAAFVILGSLYAMTAGAFFSGIPAGLLAIGFLAVPFLVWEQYGSALLMAVGRVDLYNRGQVAGRLLTLVVVVFALTLLDAGLAAVAGAIVAGHAVVALYGTGTLWSLAGGGVRPRLKAAGRYARGGLQLHMTTVGTLLFASAEILILQHFRGAAETGLYQLAQQLSMLLLVLPASTAMIAYGQVVAGGADGFWGAHKALMTKTVMIVTAGAGVAWVAAPVAIPLIAGPAFGDSVPVFRWLLLAMPAKALAVAFAPQWIGRGLFWQASALTLGLGVINVAACIVLAPRLGMAGVAAATVATSMLSLLVNLYVITRFNRSGARAS